MVLNSNCRTLKCAVSLKDMNTQQKKCFSFIDRSQTVGQAGAREEQETAGPGDLLRLN